ncbi:hypothetical protein Gotur_034697 [Gossypium turneri]
MGETTSSSSINTSHLIGGEKAGEKKGNKTSPGVTVKYFDNTDAPYVWLLPGWIVGESFVPSNYKGRERIYKNEGNNGGLIYLIDPTATHIIERNKMLFNNPT